MRLLPHVGRSFEEVDGDLLELLGKLAAGDLPWPLFLHGPTGTGKSCAALALADVCDTAAFYEADDFASFVMQRNDDVPSELERLASKELLIVDEIGCRGKIGDLAYGTLKTLIDLRANGEKHGAIFISNLTPGQLARPEMFDDRIVSRLTAGTLCRLDGRDRRDPRR